MWQLLERKIYFLNFLFAYFIYFFVIRISVFFSSYFFVIRIFSIRIFLSAFFHLHPPSAGIWSSFYRHPMQCNTFGTDFHLIQNGGTTKWFDALFDFLAAEAFPGILQPIKSTIATWAPLKLKRRNVVFKLKNTTFILFFLSARYDLSTISLDGAT